MKMDQKDVSEILFHLGRESAAVAGLFDDGVSHAFEHRLAVEEFARAFNRLAPATQALVWNRWQVADIARVLWDLAVHPGVGKGRAAPVAAVRMAVKNIVREAKGELQE